MKPYFERDGISIYLGDCRDVLPTLDAGSVDLVLTDPPYGMAYRHGTRKGGKRYGNDGVTIFGDDAPFDPSPLLTLSGKKIIWGGNHFADRLPASRGWMVWDKRDGRGSNDQSDCELAWTDFLTVARVYTRVWRGGQRDGREQAEGRLHVNQKPVALLSWCIRLSDTTAAIIDPYMGSGSTLIAARDLGRRAIGIEIEERYCEVAAKRLDQMSLFEDAS